MPKSAAILLRSAALAGLLALAACSRGGDENNLAAMDNSLIGNGADPALTSALEDQILVDPNLVQQTHPNSARPPETPVQAQYPADNGTAAMRPARRPGAARPPPPMRGSGGPPMPSACGVPFASGDAMGEPPSGRIPGLSGRPRHRGGGRRPRRLPYARRHLHHRAIPLIGCSNIIAASPAAPASRSSSSAAAATRCSAAPAARRLII